MANAKNGFTICHPELVSGSSRSMKGFTLIELLVVVLIIGILAAVAVPQYQKAVERSHAMEALTLLKSVGQSFETYFMANGSYPTRFDELDIQIPWERQTAPKFYSLAKDTLSNGEWSLEIENNSNSVLLHMARINGKYKGAGFWINYTGEKGVFCFERTHALTPFSSSLSSGGYCEKVMQGTFWNGDSVVRAYFLP